MSDAEQEAQIHEVLELAKRFDEAVRIGSSGLLGALARLAGEAETFCPRCGAPDPEGYTREVLDG